ncbi:3-oxoacyl-ACP synthase [Nocardia sp. ET3-3]|uniref:3-oxoacyl-ACP synthase n=1 Tax=Nocardia terrae TaxID=2675851 RepID=A0A7K1V493_9NOCA|nr:beta-ketoacyl-[acyl-carrier-protein] synthase family protein [Nocardia terrae]MVU81311.1 3-oxoacyl-ACP synthase [Nocardia terrae]
MARPIVRESAQVTGLGVVSAAGSDLETFWGAILSGRPTTTVVPALHDSMIRLGHAVPDGDLDDTVDISVRSRADRFIQLAIAAARKAFEDAGLSEDEVSDLRTAVVIGNSLGGVSTMEVLDRTVRDEGERFVSPLTLPAAINNMAAGYIAMELGCHGPAYVVSTACASSTDALGLAMKLIRSGECDLVIAGGTEAALTAPVTAAFHRMGAIDRSVRAPGGGSRAFASDRSGFTLGEAAAILVVESATSAARRGARTYAEITGYAATNDAYHVTSPEPEGQWYRQAIVGAVADAGIGLHQLDYWNLHGTGTVMNDAVETKVVNSLVGEKVPVSTTKPVTGHCLGAAGAVEAVVALLSILHEAIPPNGNGLDLDPALNPIDLVTIPRTGRVNYAMSSSLGFGGHNAAVVFAKTERTRP